MSEKLCHCQSERLFVDCCGPLLAGSCPAPTAEALMRSRYTANVLKNTTYLLETWHLSTRPQSMNSDILPTWCGLSVLAIKQGQQGDDRGTVEFRAFYRSGTGSGVLHERSRFVCENGCWLYVDGELLESAGLTSGKTGRNQPCPCGSGKKYKKCCLKLEKVNKR